MGGRRLFTRASAWYPPETGLQVAVDEFRRAAVREGQVVTRRLTHDSPPPRLMADMRLGRLVRQPGGTRCPAARPPVHPDRTHHGRLRGGALTEDLHGDVTLELGDAREAPEPGLTGEGQRLPFPRSATQPRAGSAPPGCRSATRDRRPPSVRRTPGPRSRRTPHRGVSLRPPSTRSTIPAVPLPPRS